ncbi:hypothetical protein [Deinococcus sp.]|uniref:hypothetical protein n=1 Tax=Deinococcus sp. TaxID=47478 RepID=UPI0025E98F35|nr:hypothetical protein [Deinococcus sp.]
MKTKTLLSLTALALCASSASAASYVGGSVGSGLTAHYQYDTAKDAALRFGLNLTAVGFNFNTLTLGVGADYLKNFGSVAGLNDLNPYYGFGLDAGLGLGGVNYVALYPHGLVGAKYNLAASPISIFGELNAGPAFAVGSTLGVNVRAFSFGIGARLGLNYKLN